MIQLGHLLARGQSCQRQHAAHQQRSAKQHEALNHYSKQLRDKMRQGNQQIL